MKNIRFFLSENFHFLVAKFSEYLNRHIFVMTLGKYFAISADGDNVVTSCLLYCIKSSFQKGSTLKKKKKKKSAKGS